MPRKYSVPLCLCLSLRLHAETRQTISQHLFRSMQVWLPVLKPLHWGVRLSLQGSAALSKAGERDGCHAIQTGWVGLQKRQHQGNQCPMRSPDHCVRGCFYLGDAAPGTGTTGEGKGSPSSGVFLTTVHTRWAGIRSARNRSLQSHPHLPWWGRWGTSQSPREARAASGRSGRRTIWTRRTRQAAHCEGDGPAALLLHWKPPCSQRWESPSVRRHSWKVPLVREEMRKTRAGAEASTWRPSRRGNFSRITVSPAKQRQDWSTARWGTEVITAVTAHPICHGRSEDSGGLSTCWHERSILTVTVTPPERVCCW